MPTTLQDLSTIIWKEWKELLAPCGAVPAGGIMGLVLDVGIFGILLPVQLGAELVRSPNLLLFWAWVPLFLVITVIADAFAGERERHTLETLLATRLSIRLFCWAKSRGHGAVWLGIDPGQFGVGADHG